MNKNTLKSISEHFLEEGDNLFSMLMEEVDHDGFQYFVLASDLVNQVSSKSPLALSFNEMHEKSYIKDFFLSYPSFQADGRNKYRDQYENLKKKLSEIIDFGFYRSQEAVLENILAEAIYAFTSAKKFYLEKSYSPAEKSNSNSFRYELHPQKAKYPNINMAVSDALDCGYGFHLCRVDDDSVLGATDQNNKYYVISNQGSHVGVFELKKFKLNCQYRSSGTYFYETHTNCFLSHRRDANVYAASSEESDSRGLTMSKANPVLGDAISDAIAYAFMTLCESSVDVMESSYKSSILTNEKFSTSGLIEKSKEDYENNLGDLTDYYARKREKNKDREDPYKYDYAFPAVLMPASHDEEIFFTVDDLRFAENSKFAILDKLFESKITEEYLGFINFQNRESDSILELIEPSYKRGVLVCAKESRGVDSGRHGISMNPINRSRLALAGAELETPLKVARINKLKIYSYLINFYFDDALDRIKAMLENLLNEDFYSFIDDKSIFDLCAKRFVFLSAGKRTKDRAESYPTCVYVNDGEKNVINGKKPTRVFGAYTSTYKTIKFLLSKREKLNPAEVEFLEELFEVCSSVFLTYRDQRTLMTVNPLDCDIESYSLFTARFDPELVAAGFGWEIIDRVMIPVLKTDREKIINAIGTYDLFSEPSPIGLITSQELKKRFTECTRKERIEEFPNPREDFAGWRV